MEDGNGPWADRFLLVNRLGEGGMGVVYEAIEASTRAVVALKVMRRADPKALQRFKREFRALADIHHPNLVALYELFAAPERWAFSMELARGPSLASLIRASIPSTSEIHTESGESTPSTLDERALRRPGSAPVHPPQLAAERVRSIARQLATGIARLHVAGHVHCDIKPSNVLVGDDERVVLCDFGLVDAHRARARAVRAHAAAGLARAVTGGATPRPARAARSRRPRSARAASGTRTAAAAASCRSRW